MGLFSKIKEGLFKTRGSVGQKMDQLVENSRALDDDFYDELSDILVMADVGVTTATEAVDELRERVGSGVHASIVLDKTPFYAEMGGQSADHGLLILKDAVFEVHDVQKNKAGKVLLSLIHI